ncbi:MAG: hypothetical protein MJZ57_09440, partial [Bacteroidales bacterium]|nr:hypothetical protein [Bacteroidales bacterium]
MKKIILTMVLFCVVCVSALAQNTITMKFSGRNQNNEWIPLSNVLVENQTQNWQEMIYYPDTMITMGSGVGIDDYLQNEKVKLFQNVPNPFDGVTDFALQLDEGQRVLLEIYDVNGKMVAQYENALPQGQHLFRTTLTAPQTYLLSAKTENDRLHIKMVNKGNGGENSIAYLGEGGSIQYQLKSDTKDDATHNFAIGDWMKYVGYANLCGTEYESVPVEKSQTQSETVNLVFTLPLAAVTVENATNITSTSARLNGNANGQECEVTERGFFYGMTANNLTTKVTASGVGNGDFQTEISNLLPGTHYYYKAYAKTITGMAYSNEISFQTNATLPTITTTSVSSITSMSATSGGNVTADGGATVTARGVCWSTSQNPTMADSHTTNGSGTGSFSSSITGLSANTTYYVRAYATNSVGTAYGSQISFTPAAGQPCPGVATVTDYDGNTYNTVQIGQQCWMKENLKTTHYSDGTSISLGSSTSTTTAYRYYPNNDSSNVSTYGYLYNWPAVMQNSSSSSANPSGVQGICPTGWHVPSDAEWTQLTDYVSSQSQYVCGSNSTYIAKALASTTGWNSYSGTCCVGNDPSGNNATGFSAVPAGRRLTGNFYDFGRLANFWSATQSDDSFAWYRYLGYDGSGVYSYDDTKNYGFSVRCLRDAGSSASLP